MDQADPDHPFVTDGGHYTADCTFDGIRIPHRSRSRSNASPAPSNAASSSGLARAAVVAGGEEGTETIEAKPR